MSAFDPQGASENPYKSYDESGRLPAYEATAAGFDAKLIRKFRGEIHALGAFWMLIGLLTLGLGAAIGTGVFGPVSGGLGQVNEQRDAAPILAAVLFAIGALYLLVGLAACMKHLWAVYVGLVLSYLSLVGNLFSLNLCGIVILAIVILQGHRVVKWAGEMRRAGVPLTAKP